MPSAIDSSKPVTGSPQTQNVRDNFLASKDELNDLLHYSTDMVTSAGVDTITVTYAIPLVLADGVGGSFRALSTITSTTPTLNVDGTGAKTIVRENDAALKVTDIIAGGLYFYKYNSSTDNYVLINPSSAGTTAADDVSNTPSGSISSTDVQAAINELAADDLVLQSNIDTLETSVDNKLTDVITTVITATDAAWVPNSNTKRIEFTAVGGGGGGGGVDGNGSPHSSLASSGGGGGSTTKSTNSIAASYNITIGAAGSGGGAGFNNGSNGGDTTVVGGVVSITANGGKKGKGRRGSDGAEAIEGGVGGTASGGDVNSTGGSAGYVVHETESTITVITHWAKAGDSVLGHAPHDEYATAGAGISGTTYGYGVGGTGGQSLTAANYAGGAGAQGVVIVKEYVGTP